MLKNHYDKFIPICKNSLKKLKTNLETQPHQHIYIFDIDETLYPENLKIKQARRKKYLEFLFKQGYSHDEAWNILNKFSEKYGVAIKGFVHEYNVTEEVYNELLERDVEDYAVINFDHEGKELFTKLEGIKICLTNSDHKHSYFVLERMGLLEHMDYIFHCDYENKNFICKPEEKVFHIVEKFLKIRDKKKVHFFDDKLVNIESAKKFGWNGYLVTNAEDYKYLLKKINKE